MREIKFRGKREHDGEWVYGVPIFFPDESVYLVTIGCFRLDKTIITPSTLGQYTGLKDKNSMDIYEGDVVKTMGFLPIAPEGIGIVEYDPESARFFFNQIAGDDYAFYMPDGDNWRQDEIAVIGNIHDNPELLDEGGVGVMCNIECIDQLKKKIEQLTKDRDLYKNAYEYTCRKHSELKDTLRKLSYVGCHDIDKFYEDDNTEKVE